MRRDSSYVDVHYQHPAWPYDLQYVGLEGLYVNAHVHLWKEEGCKERLIELSLLTDLPRTVRGSHISRSIKAIESRLNGCKKAWDLLRELGESALQAHEYSNRAQVGLKTSVLLEGGLFELRLIFEKQREGREKYLLTIETEGITSCPSALSISLQRTGEKMTHTQRARLIASVTSDVPIKLDGLPRVVRDSFSRSPRAYLNREEESRFVEELFNNTMFTEDVARKALDSLSVHLRKNGLERACVSVHVKSLESVHSFDIVARGEECW